MTYEEYCAGPMACGGLPHIGCPDNECVMPCKMCGILGLHPSTGSALRCFSEQYPELGVVVLERD